MSNALAMGVEFYTLQMFRIELLSWESARSAAAPIRFTVFVEEQRVPTDIELDEHDATSLHALARNGQGEVIGTGRLLSAEDHASRSVGHIGRMAVLAAWRGRGAGGAILEALVDAARARGDTEVALSAQSHALAFYRAHGFVAEGEDYIEAGIMHRDMRRSLQSLRT
jgi:predicted GNAT family N-acyltransferase